MQLTNSPGKLVLPFANAGAKNTIPVASQIGITAGAASLTDGFPPLTRTPKSAGGKPPSGLDMNGILYELSAAVRWANAGGQYQWDSVFAADSNTGGYPQGCLVLSTDGAGFWRSTADNNTANPEAATATPTWAPQGFGDITSVAMASANVTLTPLQAARPVIVITGTLTANLNLVFPVFSKEWRVINNATGAYAVTCKTSGGTGVTINNGDAQLVYGDGTNIVSMRVAGAVAVQQEANTYAQATGTVDALVGAFTPAITATTLAAGITTLTLMPTGANATTTPTFTPNTGVIAPATIVKGNNQALAAGDIAGANHPIVLMWSAGLSKWVLLNPATGVSGQSSRLQSITASVASNALTLTYNGGMLDFRNATQANGVPNSGVVVASNSITIPSGATLGTVNGQQARLVLLEAYNGGSPVLCVVNPTGGLQLDEANLISPTTISSGATAANVIYSASAVSASSPYRVVGFVDITETTAGTWASAPTTVQGIGGQALAALSSLGYGQTAQDVSASRSAGTTYYNTTGKPKVVTANTILVASITLTPWITVNGFTAAWIGGNGGATNQGASATVLVPPGGSYVFASSANWSGLKVSET